MSVDFLRKVAKNRLFDIGMGFIAVLASTTNVVSGYLITDRMLKMFKKRGSSK